MRKLSLEAPGWKPPDRSGEELRLSIKVITPLFGGSAILRETDNSNPVRAASVRGHLRFWWRATAGASCKSSKELFERESAIWGSAATKEDKNKNVVAIRVTEIKAGTEKRYSDITSKSAKDGPMEGYFLFPFQEQDNYGREGISFSLILFIPANCSSQEVKLAVRAWIYFGGIGSRTRRGCGALALDEKIDWLPSPGAPGCWNDLVVLHDGYPVIPTLSDATVILGSPKQTSMGAWKELGRFWSAFRKGHVGKDAYVPMNGCKWDDYRGALMPYERNPSGSIELNKPFLGLPIIYQEFKSGSPKQTALYHPTLVSEKSGRMASPVILRPVEVADGKFASMVLVLKSPPPESIRIQNDIVKLSAKPNDPVLNNLGVHDPLEAVIVFAEEHFGVDRIILGGTP